MFCHMTSATCNDKSYQLLNAKLEFLNYKTLQQCSPVYPKLVFALYFHPCFLLKKCLFRWFPFNRRLLVFLEVKNCKTWIMMYLFWIIYLNWSTQCNLSVSVLCLSRSRLALAMVYSRWTSSLCYHYIVLFKRVEDQICSY